MYSEQETRHIHPSAIAIFIPGFGDAYALRDNEVVIADAVNNDEKDISSVQITHTVRNQPGTFSIVLQNNNGKFILPDNPHKEIPILYNTSKNKQSVNVAFSKDDIVKTDNLGNVYTQPLPGSLKDLKTEQIKKAQWIYSYVHFTIDSEIKKLQSLVSENMNSLQVEILKTKTLTLDQNNSQVIRLLENIDEYDSITAKVKREEDIIRNAGGNIETQDVPSSDNTPFVPTESGVSQSRSNKYEYPTYTAFSDAPIYTLVDDQKSYPTQYVRNKSGQIQERWSFLDDGTIVYLSRSADEETTLGKLFEDTDNIEKSLKISPYGEPKSSRTFTIRKTTAGAFLEDNKDIQEQGIAGFDKGKCKIHPMDRVVIFMTPRFDPVLNDGTLNQDDKGNLIRAFTGVVNTVQEGYSNGHHQITVTGEDVTKYMKLSIINVNPALELEQYYKIANQNTSTEPINIWSDILQGLTTPDIIRVMTLGSDAIKTKNIALNQKIDAIGWYKFPDRGPVKNDIVWTDNIIKKLRGKKDNTAKYDFTKMLGELFKPNSVHILDPFREGDLKLEGFKPYELVIQNNWSFYQADFKTRRDIAYKSAEDSQFNFYADRHGHIWFHPYRFDLSWIIAASNPKVYIIDTQSIISYGFVEDDTNLFTSVYVTTEPDFRLESIQKYGLYHGSYLDAGAVLKYGQRIYVATNPIINTKLTDVDVTSKSSIANGVVLASNSANVYAKSLLQRILAGKYQGQITLSGRVEMDPGRPVYIPMRNMVYFVETIDHSLTFGQEYQTTIHLSYGRKPWEYLPELLTFSSDDEIYMTDAYTFAQKYVDQN